MTFDSYIFKFKDLNKRVIDRFLAVAFLSFCTVLLHAQSSGTTIEGRVSYLSMRNAYVSFASTEGISVGDTLFIRSDNELLPVLLVTSLSSISCITKPLDDVEPEIDEVIIAHIAQKEESVVSAATTEKQQTEMPEAAKIAEKEKKNEQHISGRLSVKSYSNFSNTSSNDNQRMRYTFSFQGDHLANSRVSADSYINFTHKAGEWGKVRDNIFNGLKIYSLALKYDISDNSNVWLGRKINSNMSNMGAIDGLQAETTFGNITLGLAAGSRPDYTDYGFNLHLLQVGGFVAHNYTNDNGNINTSLGLFEQTNSGKTDRRFAYFQHSNSMIKKVNIFTSCELDMYQVKNGVQSNTLSLTGVYISLRYKPIKQLSLFTSYDARKNVIYYETYKSTIDSVFENATRQGYRFNVLWRPAKMLTVSTNAGYRYRKGDGSASKNASTNITYTKVPWINASASANVTLLKTSYLDGMQYGLRLSRDFFDGKIYSSLNYRITDYQYASSLLGIKQDAADLSVSWRLPYRFQLSVDYEATFESGNVLNRLFLGLVKRF